MELTVENPALAARAADICRGTFKVRKTDRWAGEGGSGRSVGTGFMQFHRRRVANSAERKAGSGKPS